MELYISLINQPDKRIYSFLFNFELIFVAKVCCFCDKKLWYYMLATGILFIYLASVFLLTLHISAIFR